MVEIRIILDNFINSSVDYDPEISVLFDGGGNGGNSCNSDEYDVVGDYIFWASLSCFIFAICVILLVLLIASTPFGRKLYSGRETVDAVLKRRARIYNERLSSSGSSSTTVITSAPAL